MKFNGMQIEKSLNMIGELCFHFWNELCWLAFASRNMEPEMSCPEKLVSCPTAFHPIRDPEYESESAFSRLMNNGVSDSELELSREKEKEMERKKENEEWLKGRGGRKEKRGKRGRPRRSCRGPQWRKLPRMILPGCGSGPVRSGSGPGRPSRRTPDSGQSLVPRLIKKRVWCEFLRVTVTDSHRKRKKFVPIDNFPKVWFEKGKKKAIRDSAWQCLLQLFGYEGP